MSNMEIVMRNVFSKGSSSATTVDFRFLPQHGELERNLSVIADRIVEHMSAFASHHFGAVSTSFLNSSNSCTRRRDNRTLFSKSAAWHIRLSSCSTHSLKSVNASTSLPPGTANSSFEITALANSKSNSRKMAFVA